MQILGVMVARTEEAQMASGEQCKLRYLWAKRDTTWAAFMFPLIPLGLSAHEKQQFCDLSRNSCAKAAAQSLVPEDAMCNPINPEDAFNTGRTIYLQGTL